MKYGSYEWYLYHDRKNETPVLYLILLSVFLLFCHDGIASMIVIWIIYFVWAKNNNDKLNENPQIIKEREIWQKSREQKQIEEARKAREFLKANEEEKHVL